MIEDNLELDRRLKEAGFPQEDAGESRCLDGEWFYHPSVERLFDELNENIFSVLNLKKTNGAHAEEEKKGNKWGVMGFDHLERAHFKYSPTVRGVLSELWIELKGKHD